MAREVCFEPGLLCAFAGVDAGILLVAIPAALERARQVAPDESRDRGPALDRSRAATLPDVEARKGAFAVRSLV